MAVYVNVITDLRVLQCHIKRRRFIRLRQLPFQYLDDIEISSKTIRFRNKRYVGNVTIKSVNIFPIK